MRRCRFLPGLVAAAALLANITAAFPAEPPKRWWEGRRMGAGWTSEPLEGGRVIRVFPRTRTPVELPWPTDPQGFRGRFLVWRGNRQPTGAGIGRAGPAGFDLEADDVVLLRQEEGTTAAIACVLEPGSGVVRWSKEAPRDPFLPTYPVLRLSARDRHRPLEFWVAEGAPAESLWVRRERILLRRAPEPAPGPGSGMLLSASPLRALPPAGSPDDPGAPWGQPLIDLGLTFLVVSPERLEGASGDSLRVRLAGWGLEPAVRRAPFAVSPGALRRLPRDAAIPLAGGPGGRLLPTVSGRREARRAASGHRDLLQLVEPGTAGERLLAAFSGVGEPGRVLAASLFPGGSNDSVLAEQFLLLAVRGPAVTPGVRIDLDPAPHHRSEGEDADAGNLQWVLAALSGGPVLVEGHGLPWIRDGIHPEEPGSRSYPGPGISTSGRAARSIERLLPPLGRAARAEDLFSIAPPAAEAGGKREVATGALHPHRFRVSGPGRDLLVLVQAGEGGLPMRVRPLGPPIPDDGTGKVLVFDTTERSVRGVFFPREEMLTGIDPRRARLMVVVPDRERPYLVATGAHWTEGIQEVIEERWDGRRNTLYLRLKRAPGAVGELVIATDRELARPPLTLGAAVGDPRRSIRGPRPILFLPFTWTAAEARLELIFEGPVEAPAGR